MVKCLPSAACSAFCTARSGMYRAMASATNRSSAARPILWANPATWASTNRAACMVSPRVAWAIRRARHTGRSPVWVRSQSRVSRYFSSTASATSARPESVERPRAAANSAIQNSATSGAPGPASGRPVSPPPQTQVAASSIDSGGCCSAQVTAAYSTSASARSATARRSRANPSTAEAESRSGRVVVICEFNHRPPTVSRACSRMWITNLRAGMANSTGCCNEPRVEGLGWSLPFQGHSGSGVQPQGDVVAVGLGQGS